MFCRNMKVEDSVKTKLSTLLFKTVKINCTKYNRIQHNRQFIIYSVFLKTTVTIEPVTVGDGMTNISNLV